MRNLFKRAITPITLVVVFCFFNFAEDLKAQDISTIVKNVQPSVVMIITLDKNDSALLQGTGFFINGKGDVVSNLHVFEGAEKALIKTYDGKIYPVKQYLVEDTVGDLLIVSVDITDKIILPLKICPSLPTVGEKIIVVGNPCGLEQTVSDGIVSSIREISGLGNIVQITAPISTGSSGSPVINLNGDVIGVATLNVTLGQNLNFAMPSKRLVQLTSNISISKKKDIVTANTDSRLLESTISKRDISLSLFPVSLLISKIEFINMSDIDTTMLKTLFINNIIKNHDFKCIDFNEAQKVIENDDKKQSNSPSNSLANSIADISIDLSIRNIDDKFAMSFVAKNLKTGEVELAITDEIKSNRDKLKSIYWQKFCSICLCELNKIYLFREADTCFKFFSKIRPFKSNGTWAFKIDLFDILDFSIRAMHVSHKLSSMMYQYDFNKNFAYLVEQNDFENVYDVCKCSKDSAVQCCIKNIETFHKITDDYKNLYLTIDISKGITQNVLEKLDAISNKFFESQNSFVITKSIWNYDFKAKDSNRLKKYSVLFY